jgi:hypothetical protein
VDVEDAREKANLVGLRVLATIFQVGDSVFAQAGHVRQLSEAEAIALSKDTQMGQAMWLNPSLFRGGRFHVILSFEALRHSLSERHCWCGAVHE